MKKRRVAFAFLGVVLLVLLSYVVANTFFVTVQVYFYRQSSPYMSQLFTLYGNGVLVVSDVDVTAEESKLMRLFQIPRTIKCLSKEDYLTVRHLLEALEGKESEVSRQDCFISAPPLYYCLIGETNHYVLHTWGTAEAYQIIRMLEAYEMDRLADYYSGYGR